MKYSTTLNDQVSPHLTSVVDSYVEITDHVFTYVEAYYANKQTVVEEEEMYTTVSTDEEILCVNEYKFKRECITGSHKHRYDTSKVWGLTVFAQASCGCEMFFKTDKKAKEVQEFLMAWITK